MDSVELNHTDIRQLVFNLLGAEPTEVASTGSPYAAFLTVSGRRLVAKTSSPNHPGSALIEAWAYRECQRRGVSVPKVLVVSTEPECVIVAALPGHSLWSEERQSKYDRAVWSRAGEDLRKVHEIQLPGFGPLVIDDRGEPRGEANSWCPFVRYARDEGIEYLARAGYISDASMQLIERRYDDAASLLNSYNDGRLLHGDLEGGHVFATSAGAYSGLIDFHQAQVGDPRWDLARVVLWDGQEALDALLDGYGRDKVSQEDRDIVFPLYLLAFVVHQAVQLDRTGRHDAAREHLQQVGSYEAKAG